METVKRYLSGRHTVFEIRLHLAALVTVYWGLVFCAWLGYSERRSYSVMTEMLSALGSFDDRHNPHWFWVFSVAMVYCGLVMTPVMLYIRRRIVSVSYWGSMIGTFFLLVGCTGIVLTGLFPYAHVQAIGDWEWSRLHLDAASLIIVGFSFGILCNGALLLKDRFSKKTLASQGRYPYLKILGPYLVCAPVFCLLGYRIRWGAAYAAIVGSVHASRRETADALFRALNGLHGFALLEHLAIWALTIYVVWFAAALPHEMEAAVLLSPADGE